MAIVAADLKFLSSERMTDGVAGFPNAIGGGQAAGPVVLTGVPNSVFPAAMPSDLIAGRLQLRQLYPAVLSNENSQAANVQVAVYQRPADALTSLLAFAHPSTSLADVDFSVRNAIVAARSLGGTTNGKLSGVGGSSLYDLPNLASVLAVGDKVALRAGDVFYPWRTVTALNGPAGTLSFAGGGLAGVAADALIEVLAYGDCQLLVPGPGDTLVPTITPVSAVAHTTAGVSGGAQELTLDRLEVRVLPVLTPSGEPWSADDWRRARRMGGVLPAFYPGAAVLVDDPANGAVPEVRIVERVNYQTGVVRFTTTLANAYGTGSRVSRLIARGNLQAQVSLAPFAQQAWTRLWADNLQGNPISPRYSGVIAMNNAGGITDRWAIVFNSATAFSLVSERFGQIAQGNTLSDFVPLNPLTSQPYFTLPAAGWGSGWLAGNVVRFNTQGAHAPLWYGRCIAPGASGADEGALIIRADV